MATIIASIAAFLVVSSFLWHRAWLRDPAIAEENHLLEWLQIVAEVLAALLFFSGWRRSTDVVDRFKFFGLGLLCVSFAMRELAIRQSIDGTLGIIVHRTLRWEAAVAWIIYFAAASFHWRVLVSAFPRFCWSGIGRLVVFCGILFVVAWPFDHWRFAVIGLSSGFIEELLEFQGAFLLMAASLTMRLSVAKRQTAHAVRSVAIDPTGDCSPPIEAARFSSDAPL